MISKEDIRKAFLTDQRKRNKLLYDFYKEEYFSSGYTARLIAAKISEDLGIEISVHIIFKIYARIIKKATKATDPATQPVKNPKAVKTGTVETGTKNPSIQKVQNRFIFRNAEDEPKKEPFEDAFKDI